MNQLTINNSKTKSLYSFAKEFLDNKSDDDIQTKFFMIVLRAISGCEIVLEKKEIKLDI